MILRISINLIEARIGNHLQKAEGEKAKKDMSVLDALIPEIEKTRKVTLPGLELPRPPKRGENNTTAAS